MNLPYVKTSIKPEYILQLMPPDLNKVEVKKFYFF